MSVTFSGSDHGRLHPRVEGCFASVDLDLDDPSAVNWCNGDAAVLLDLLGLAHGEDGLVGEVTIAEARRAIVRARATLDRRGPGLERPDRITYGAPRALPDGTVELRPLRVFGIGLDVVGMRERIDAFERCVSALAQRGATHITWG